MLIDFFLKLKGAKLPVTTKEFLMLLEALKEHVSHGSVDDFYYLARAALIKDETNYDKYDRVFGEYFRGLESIANLLEINVPDAWLKKLAELNLSPEDKAKIEAMGGWDKLLE